MKMLSMLLKILKITKQNKQIYKALTRIRVGEMGNRDLPNLNEAMSILDSAHSEPINKKLQISLVKKKKYDLKIIIGVHNAGKYLNTCLKSILSQKTNYSFNITIIDDGSTDMTTDILKQYVQIPCINIIEQGRQGIAATRNIGLKTIDSHYIMFVDADDTLAGGAIQNLLDTAYENNSDLVVASYRTFLNRFITIHQTMYTFQRTLGKIDIKDGYPWGKLFRSELFTKVKFPEGFLFEDTILIYLIYPQCKIITSVSNIIYNYRYNLRGVTQTSKGSLFSIDSFWVTNNILRDIKKYELSYDQYMYEVTLRQIKVNFMRTSYLDENIKKSIFVLSELMLSRYFEGFSTSDVQLRPLDIALHSHNYINYALFCLLFS